MLNENNIISEIYSAFGNTRKPVDDCIVFSKYWNGHQWVQNPYKDAETYIIGHFLSNKTWQELSQLLGEWKDGRSCLSFLTAEGFAYYLPAYMLFILKETKHDLWDDFLGTTIFHLEPPKIDSEQYKKYDITIPPDEVIQHGLSEYNKFISQLTKEQRSTIVNFLKYISDHYADTFVFEDEKLLLISLWESFLERAGTADI